MSDALDLMRALVLADGRRWGEVAYPFQIEDAGAVLSSEGPPFHFLTRSRGGSKTSDLAAVALAMLLTAPPRSRLYWLASDLEQGQAPVDVIGGYASRTAGLSGALDIQARKVTARETGSTLEVLAADAPGAWGLLPYAVFVDELCQWADTTAPKRLWQAVSSAAAKTDDSRLVVLTTPGDPAHFSHEIYEHAHADSMWRVNEVKGPAPWLSPERVEEQRRRLPESMFRRLFMGEWAEGEDRLSSREDLEACVTLDGPLERDSRNRYIIGLDLGIKRDRTVATVCHAEPFPDSDTGRRIVLDRKAMWKGSRARAVNLGDVESWVEQAANDYRARVVIDPWQAVGMAQRLRARGIRVQEFTFSAQSVGRLASTLYGLIRERALALPDDDELIDELSKVRIRETSPGVFRMDHDPGEHDDQALSLALAAHALIQGKAKGGAVIGPDPFSNPDAQPRPEDLPLFDRVGKAHDTSTDHRRWSQRHYCDECATEFEANPVGALI